VVSLVLPLNPGPPARSRVDVLVPLLDFRVVPPGYREDMLTCLGLAARYAAPDEVLTAGRRLAQGTVALLAEHASAYRAPSRPGRPTGCARAACAGTFRAH
jgi:phosphoribosyl-AMP cyclohydrolase